MRARPEGTIEPAPCVGGRAGQTEVDQLRDDSHRASRGQAAELGIPRLGPVLPFRRIRGSFGGGPVNGPPDASSVALRAIV